jgi:hypothetical protein
MGKSHTGVPIGKESNVKVKILFFVQWVVIVALATLLLKQFVSFGPKGPVVREPQTPGESTLAYTPPPAPKFSAEDLVQLEALKKKFSPTLEKITDRIYLARAFALGSVAMIITDDGLVIVDTTESRSVAEEILAEFREITDLPVKYIIYTHGHRDHTLGAPAFFSQGVEVIATNAAVRLLKTYHEELRAFHDRSRANQSGRLAAEYSMPTLIKSIFKPDADPEDNLARIIKSFSLDYLGYLSGNLNMFGFYRSAAAMERKHADFKP